MEPIVPCVEEDREMVISGSGVTVRDGVAACMSWRTQSPCHNRTTASGKQKKSSCGQDEKKNYHKYLPRPLKTPVGQTRNHGHDHSDEDWSFKRPDGVSNAQQALRGWPRERKDRNQDDMPQAPPSGNNCQHDDDPQIGELISGKWYNKSDSANQSGSSQSGNGQKLKIPKGGLPNRSQQLRQIHSGNQIVVEKELWQMPKFKDNAKPHIDTGSKIQQDRRENFVYAMDEADMYSKWEAERERLNRESESRASNSRNAARSPVSSMGDNDPLDYIIPNGGVTDAHPNCMVHYGGLPNDINYDAPQNTDYNDFDV